MTSKQLPSLKSYRSRGSERKSSSKQAKHPRSFSTNSPNIIDVEFGSSLLDSVSSSTTNKNTNHITDRPILSNEPSDSMTPTLMEQYSDKNKRKYREHISKASIFKWILTGSTLDAFKRSRHEQGFESKEFKISNSSHRIIKDIIWKLECFPNGIIGDDLNKIKLYLTSVDLPPNISKIVVCFSLLCVETGVRYVGTDEFSYNLCQCQWDDDCMSFNRIQTMDTLTFECFIDVLQIHYENDIRTGGKAKESKIKLYSDLHFEWNIDKTLLTQFKQSNIGQLFCSPNYGHFWFQLIPNGYTADNKGKMKLYLESIGILPSGLRCIKVKYRIKCVEKKFEREDIVKIKKKGGYSAVANFNFGKLKEIKKLKCLTLICNICIVSIYDSKRKEIQKKYWKKYGIINIEHQDHLNQQDEGHMIEDESISKDTDHTVIIHDDDDLLGSHSPQSTTNDILLRQPMISIDSSISHCIDDRDNEEVNTEEYIDTESELNKSRKSDELNNIKTEMEYKEMEYNTKEKKSSKFQVMTFDEMVSKLTNINDDGVDLEEDDDDDDAMEHKINNITFVDDDLDDDDDIGHGQRDTMELINGTESRQSRGRFTIEPSKSASILDIQSPSMSSATNTSHHTTPNASNKDVVHIVDEQSIPPRLMVNVTSKSTTKSVGTPNSDDAGYIGRFLVNKSFDSNYNELKESMDKEIENIWSDIKELKEKRNVSQTGINRNDICDLKERMNEWMKCMEQINVNQYKIMNKIGLGFDGHYGFDNKYQNTLKMWLCNGLHLDEYLDVFVKEGFEDISLLCYLNENDLIKLGIKKMGHRKKIINAIQVLKKSFTPNQAYFIFNAKTTKQDNVKIINQLQTDNDND